MIQLNRFDNKTKSAYWKLLNGVTKNGKHKKSSIIYRLDEMISVSSGNEKQFLIYLRHSDNLLHDIVLAEPEEMDLIIAFFNELVQSFSTMRFFNDSTETITPFGKIIQDIFGYNRKTTGFKKAQELVFEKIDFYTCPYCNENFIRKYDDGVKKIKAYDLDHYYSHSRYPYFGVSIYNLIPSCKTCNQIFKRNKEFSSNSHLNPYTDNIDDKILFRPQIDYDLRVNDEYSELENIIRDSRVDMHNAINNFTTHLNGKIGYNILPENECSRSLKYIEDLELYTRYNTAHTNIEIAKLFYYTKDLDKASRELLNNVLDSSLTTIDDKVLAAQWFETLVFSKKNISCKVFEKIKFDVTKNLLTTP